MKFYIPFGDWSNDGHGRYKNLLVEADSMADVVSAQKKIKDKYGEDFFIILLIFIKSQELVKKFFQRFVIQIIL